MAWFQGFICPWRKLRAHCSSEIPPRESVGSLKCGYGIFLRRPEKALVWKPKVDTLAAVKISTVKSPFCIIGLLCAFLSATPARGADGPTAGLKKVAEGLVSPSVLVSFADTGKLLVADQIGVAYLVSSDGALVPLLDLRERLAKMNQGFDERGLLGLALHPKFKENRRLFVYYSAPLRNGAPMGWDHTSHVSEFKVPAGDSAQVDLKTERVLLRVDQPQFNHNGGRMAFGPDGHLYIALGDGGQANDTGLGHPEQGNGQDTTTLLGKILRIDVDKGNPYAIPSDNPFLRGGGRPEIYAYGFRNPWGISFDRGGKHELFAADVGQDRFEEINIVVKGGNYGWRMREGFGCFDPKNPTNPPEDCPKAGAKGEPLLDPIVAYKNLKGFRRDGAGISVTGGYVYRGKAIPGLAGKYIFADWSRNWAVPDGVLFVASAPAGGTGPWEMAPLALADGAGLKAYVVAFGEDAEGEIYVLTNASNSVVGKSGKVFKLVPGI